jgi:hypothetical protein
VFIRVHPWLKRFVLGTFRQPPQLLLLMQQILAFPVSFVDLGRAFVKLPTLYFGGIPRAKLKAQLY